MPKYFGEFEYTENRWGEIDGIEADTPEMADSLIQDYVRDTFPEASNILVTTVRETDAR